MDFHIGRLIQHQKTQTSTTILSSYSPQITAARAVAQAWKTQQTTDAQPLDYTNDYDTLGLKGSYSTIGPNFASAAASPLAFYKLVGEGGMRVPLIMAGNPLALPQAEDIIHAQLRHGHCADHSATHRHAESNGRYQGRIVEPIIGRSLALGTTTQRIYGEDDAIGYELNGHNCS